MNTELPADDRETEAAHALRELQEHLPLDLVVELVHARFREQRTRFILSAVRHAGQMDGMQGQIGGLRGELRMVKWTLGGMFALMVPMLGGIVGIALQLGQR